MESDLAMTTKQYATINSIYYTTSILAPLLAGILTDKLGGGAKCLFYAVVGGALGHVVFSMGIQYDNMSLTLLGRSIAGFMYDIIDSLPLVVLQPLFENNQFGLVIGLLNGFLRLGSVANFMLSPLMYKNYGVKNALWLATGFGGFAAVFAGAILYILNVVNHKQHHEGVWYNPVAVSMSGKESIDTSDTTSDSYDNSNDSDNDTNQLSLYTEMDDINNNINTDTNDFDESLMNGVGIKKENSSNSRNDNGIDIENLTSTNKNYNKNKVLNTTENNENSSYDNNNDDNNNNEVGLALNQKSHLFCSNLKDSLVTNLPLHLFSYRYYMYCCSGACLYGGEQLIIDNDTSKINRCIRQLAVF